MDYGGYGSLAGPVSDVDQDHVTLRQTITGRDRRTLKLLVSASLLSSLVFLVWLALPGHLPGGSPGTRSVVGIVAFATILVVEAIRIVQNSTLWMFARCAADPIPMRPQGGMHVAVLTTIVPSKEPIGLVARTLAAMKQIRHDRPVDVWILDEGDDPRVKEMAAELGVRHFSRKGKPEFNQDSGAFRAKTKSGNHNAWRAAHEHEYDFVAQMDPDHVPGPEFLERTLGYFRDPDVAFVVAPQVYGNLLHSFVTRASAAQSYLFHGVVQRGGNALGAPLLIGTNHVYRTTAWRSVGGYQDSIIEDHLTSLRVNTTNNPDTGRPWEGVYTPDILAVGEGPRSWSDYFNQQMRWAYGVWEIVLTKSSTYLPKLSRSQRAGYAALQFFYPSVGLMWMLGNLLTGTYLLTGITAIDVDTLLWLGLWGLTGVLQMSLLVWLRRYNLAAHERRTWGLNGILLSLMTGPIYVAAAVSALFRRPLSYVVTAKGDSASPDSLQTFRAHVGWALALGVALVVSFVQGNDVLPLRIWACVTITASCLPILIYLLDARSARSAASRPEIIDLRDSPEDREHSVIEPVAL